MSLKDKLTADYKEAMKARDEVRKNTINLARAAIKQVEVDQRVELDEQAVIDILTKQVKMRKDALSDFEKAGRDDLIEATKKEIEVLMTYLPAQMSEEEIRAVVLATKEELGVEGKAGMGKLMGAVMPKVKGKADGGLVRQIVTEVL